MKTLKENPELLQSLKNIRCLARAGIKGGILLFYAKRSAEELGATEMQIEAFVKEGEFERESKLYN